MIDILVDDEFGLIQFAESCFNDIKSSLDFVDLENQNTVVIEDGDQPSRIKSLLAGIQKIIQTLIVKIKELMDKVRNKIIKIIKEHKLKKSINDLEAILKKDPNATIAVKKNVIKINEVAIEGSEALVKELRGFWGDIKATSELSIHKIHKHEKTLKKLHEKYSNELHDLDRPDVISVRDFLKIVRDNLMDLHKDILMEKEEELRKLLQEADNEITKMYNMRHEYWESRGYKTLDGLKNFPLFKTAISNAIHFIAKHRMLILSLIMTTVSIGVSGAIAISGAALGASEAAQLTSAVGAASGVGALAKQVKNAGGGT